MSSTELVMNLEVCFSTLTNYFLTNTKLIINYDKQFKNGYFFIIKFASNDVKVIYYIGCNQTPIYIKVCKNEEEAFVLVRKIVEFGDKTFFCKFTNKLFLTEDEYNAENLLYASKAYLVDNLEKCAVCFDYNGYETSCNHNVCLLCVIRITDETVCEECCDTCNKYVCPICREECHLE